MLNVGERNPNGGEMRTAPVSGAVRPCVARRTNDPSARRAECHARHLVQPHSSPGMGALPPSPRGRHAKAERLA